MRVTANRIYQARLREMRRRSRDMLEAQNVAASGRRMVKPSDSPGDVGRSRAVREMRGDMSAARQKVDRAQEHLASQDDALSSIGSALSEAMALTVQHATDTATTDSRITASGLIVELRDRIINLANTEVGDRYLFSGTATDQAAFTAGGVYNGSAATVSMSLPSGSSVDITLRGDEVLTGGSGGPDLLTALDDLSAALAADDTAGIRAALDPLRDGVVHIADQQALVGARTNMLDELSNQFELTDSRLIGEQSELEDADVLEAYSNLVRTQQAFESALQVTSASRTPNVFEALL